MGSKEPQASVEAGIQLGDNQSSSTVASLGRAERLAPVHRVRHQAEP